jgi:hypothetical protein
MAGDLARMTAAMMLSEISLAIAMHRMLGYPAPVLHRLAGTAVVAVVLAVLAERWSPFS